MSWEGRPRSRGATGVGVHPAPPINEVALELGLNRETLRPWVRRREREKAAEAAGGLPAAEREELKQLRRRAEVVEEEKEILRKATAFLSRRCITELPLPVRLRPLILRTAGRSAACGRPPVRGRLPQARLVLHPEGRCPGPRRQGGS